jgi:hypothetical protein
MKKNLLYPVKVANECAPSRDKPDPQVLEHSSMEDWNGEEPAADEPVPVPPPSQELPTTVVIVKVEKSPIRPQVVEGRRTESVVAARAHFQSGSSHTDDGASSSDDPLAPDQIRYQRYGDFFTYSVDSCFNGKAFLKGEDSWERNRLGRYRPVLGGSVVIAPTSLFWKCTELVAIIMTATGFIQFVYHAARYHYIPTTTLHHGSCFSLFPGISSMNGTIFYFPAFSSR